MKILLFANTDWYLYNFRLALIQELNERGDDVVLVSPDGPYGPRMQAMGIRWVRFPLTRRSLNPFNEIRTVFRLLRLYRQENPNLVHHFTVKCVLYGSLACRLLGIRSVVNSVTGLGYVFLEGEGRRLLRNLIKVFYRLILQPTWVVFQNPEDREFFLDNHLAEVQKTAVIRGSGVDVQRFSSQPEMTGIPTIILPARLLWDKGVGEFVEAARKVNKDGKKARFVLVGDIDKDNPASVQESQINYWVKEGVIEWWGWKEQMEGIFAQSSIVCLPSYREGLPKSLIEAAACSRPIITSDVPGCREIVRHGENGLLVKARDVNGLAEAMDFMIQNPTIREKMGKSGRKIAVEEFSTEKIIPQTLAVYTSCVSVDKEVSR